MKTDTALHKCPICGHEVDDSEHSRMGERNSPEGPVEYWACFQSHDVFSCKSASAEAKRGKLH